MTWVSCIPNQAYLLDGFAAVGGSAAAVLASNDNSKYIQLDGQENGQVYIKFTPLSIPPLSIKIQDIITITCASITPPDIPPQTSGGNDPGTHYNDFPLQLSAVYLYPSGVGPVPPAPPTDPQILEGVIKKTVVTNTSPRDIEMSFSASSPKYPFGFPHDQPELWLTAHEFGTDIYEGRIYNIYWKSQYVALPGLQVSGPKGLIDDDDTPPIDWADTLDDDGGPQRAFQWKIFNSDQLAS